MTIWKSFSNYLCWNSKLLLTNMAMQRLPRSTWLWKCRHGLKINLAFWNQSTDRTQNINSNFLNACMEDAWNVLQNITIIRKCFKVIVLILQHNAESVVLNNPWRIVLEPVLHFVNRAHHLLSNLKSQFAEVWDLWDPKLHSRMVTSVHAGILTTEVTSWTTNSSWTKKNHWKTM